MFKSPLRIILQTLSITTFSLAFVTSSSTNAFSASHDVAPQVTFYKGDILRAATQGSLRYAWHFSKSFWFGVEGTLGKVSLDRGTGTTLSEGDRFISAGGSFYIVLPALLGSSESESDRWNADLYSCIGAGPLWIGDETEITGHVGGGMLIYTPWKHFAARFDLRETFYGLSNSAGSDFNEDMSFSLGPSLVF